MMHILLSDCAAMIVCDVFVQGSFVNTLTAGGVQVDLLKNDVNFSTVGPYYLGINLTDVTVSTVIHLV